VGGTRGSQEARLAAAASGGGYSGGGSGGSADDLKTCRLDLQATRGAVRAARNATATAAAAFTGSSAVASTAATATAAAAAAAAAKAAAAKAAAVGGSAGASAADSAAAEEYLREQLARALRHPSGSARASSGHAHDSLGTDDNALSDPHARAAALAAADRATAAAGRPNKRSARFG
jgi:hypothetical protein